MIKWLQFLFYIHEISSSETQPGGQLSSLRYYVCFSLVISGTGSQVFQHEQSATLRISLHLSLEFKHSTPFSDTTLRLDAVRCERAVAQMTIGLLLQNMMPTHNTKKCCMH